MTVGWYVMTITVLLCCTISIVLTCIQIQSSSWYKQQSDNPHLSNKERTLLYGIFLAGVFCSAQCFTLHISNYFPSWYCTYGIGICTALYSAEKSFLYGFFLERSKSIHILLDRDFLPHICAYILPTYIVIYFLMFSILSILEYRGRIQYPLSAGIMSTCTAWRYYHWMFTVGAIVDGVTCCILLFLFIYPLYRTELHHQRLSKVIKINAFCIISCMVSNLCSMIFLGFIWNHIDFIWLLCNIDMLINSIFSFMIPDANRKYILYLTTFCKRDAANDSQSIFESATTRDLSTIYEMESHEYKKMQKQMELMAPTCTKLDTLGEIAVLKDNKSLTLSDIARNSGDT